MTLGINFYAVVKIILHQMLGTRLWLPEADRKMASPTESAVMVERADREHWGAGILNLRCARQ